MLNGLKDAETASDNSMKITTSVWPSVPLHHRLLPGLGVPIFFPVTYAQ